MVYTRASASDYDGWERDHGNPGWGSETLVPLLKEVRNGVGPTAGLTWSIYRLKRTALTL